LTGITDGLFSSVLSVAFYDSTVRRLFQGVASVLLGPDALKGGTPTAVLGVLMHFGVAFGWSIVFLFVVMRAEWILFTSGGVCVNHVRPVGHLKGRDPYDSGLFAQPQRPERPTPSR
jgi:hypothetical protein